MAAVVTISDQLQQRWGEAWLIGKSSETFWPTVAHFQAELAAQSPGDLLLCEPCPIKFLAAFSAAMLTSGIHRLWLANPSWGAQEWSQVAAQCQPDRVIGTLPTAGDRAFAAVQPRSPLPATDTAPLILIPTGGSSGDIQFAGHTAATLMASVRGFQQHFRKEAVNAYCVLPLYHVSGLMQALRCLLTGGTLTVQSWRELWQQGPLGDSSSPGFLSLVPTQLQRLLNGDRDVVPWLRSFTAILLGGAPADASLLQTAWQRRLPLAPTYGMTETASQVATLLPAEFWRGATGSGRSLPHAKIAICDDTGQPLPPGQVGRVTIAAASLAYTYGATQLLSPFRSGDLGYLDEAGSLHILGREKTLICTGGEKVQPEEVEAALHQTGTVQDAAVVGLPDQDWGERVVAVVVPIASQWHRDRVAARLRPLLSPYKIPKQYLTTTTLPRNAQGKLNRVALRQWALAQMPPTNVASGSTPALTDDAGVSPSQYTHAE